jgi:hypothetical protein
LIVLPGGIDLWRGCIRESSSWTSVVEKLRESCLPV